MKATTRNETEKQCNTYNNNQTRKEMESDQNYSYQELSKKEFS
jgi:hypothetical protein